MIALRVFCQLRWSCACLAWAAAALIFDGRTVVADQQEKHFEKEITVKAKLDYLLFLPDGYAQGDKAWPLILFLHQHTMNIVKWSRETSIILLWLLRLRLHRRLLLWPETFS